MSTYGIFSKRVLLPIGIRPATVVIDNDTISQIHISRNQPANLEIIDLGELHLMPALIDCHVHINEPGRTEWEGFHTATQAAAAGGICTLVDMPLNCQPVTTNRASLEIKMQASDNQLWVDMGFWGGVVPGNTNDLGAMAEAGILGAKAFMIHSGIDDFPESKESDLRSAMAALAKAKLPLLAHAELDLGAPESELPTDQYNSYLSSRPPEWEIEAIKLLIKLCREIGCAVHIVHLSAADALPLLRKARAEGLPITVETCPHYLCLSAEEIRTGQTQFKCAPPIRASENQDRLWEGLRDGVIDFIVSDHSPCIPQLKCSESGDFHKAWGGVSSLQLGLPSIWGEAKKRGFNLGELSKWLCERPARFIGQGRSLGKIAAGYKANLVAWDPNNAFRVEPDHLLFKHKISPFIGRTVQGKVHSTYLRGKRVYHEREFLDDPTGQFILNRNQEGDSRVSAQ